MNSRLGRPKAVEKYNDPKAYLNDHVFPIVEAVEQVKKQVAAAEKELRASKAKRSLMQQKLDYAYQGLLRWKRK